MKFHILGSRLVVKPRTPHFSSIIAKPETVMDEYSEDGEIVQAGPGCADFLEEGMHVCYHQGAGEVMKVDGEKVLILNAGDIRAYYETELADVAPI